MKIGRHANVYNRIKNINFEEVLFADDTICAATSEDAMNKLIEALRGDALTIAIEIGITKLLAEDRTGFELLKTKIREHVFPVLKDEVKTLWREGHREHV